MKTKLSLLLLAFSLYAFSANCYYISPTGTGDGSSPTTPDSPANGLSKLANVDTLYLMGGQYDLTEKVSISRSGIAGKNKVIAAYPGETPILDFRNEPYGKEVTGSDNTGLSIGSGVSYVHIKGLTIRYAGKVGLLNQGSNCIIENITVYGCGDSGIQMKNGGNNLIKNCDSYNNFDYKTLSGTNANYGGNADGFADKQHAGAPNTYIGCRAWNNADDGWDFFERVGSSMLIDCIAYNNGPDTYDMNGNPRATEGADVAWFNDFKGSGKQVTDRNGSTRTVTIAQYINLGNGNGFKVGGEKTAHNVKLSRCLAVSNKARGFDHNNNGGEMIVYNCSAYDNGCNYGFVNIENSSLTIKNCVSLASRSNNYFNTLPLTTSNNSWNTTGIICDNSDFIDLNKNLILTLRNADNSLATTDFMRLASGSDLIDVGIEASLPYAGTAPDLGCYETGTIDKFPGEVISPSNKEQTIQFGSSIANITFGWAGGATGLSVEGLPAGVQSGNADPDAKTITISGTPTVSGTYSYTVSTVGGTAIPDVATGKITILAIVSPANKDQSIVSGNNITEIVYRWLGDGISLAASGLPQGLQTRLDANAKTLTIYGSTSASEGTYTYTVSVVGSSSTETATGKIIVSSFAPSESKYYNIYSYGKSDGNSNLAKGSDAKKFLTVSGNNILLAEGMSDNDEAAGTQDPTRLLQNAQWKITAGTTAGCFVFKNRATNTHLQISGSLSNVAINLMPQFKAMDNEKPGYGIFTSAGDKCIQITNTTVGATSYAERIRMRWIIEEAPNDAAGISGTEIKTGFLKNTLVTDKIELLNPSDFASVEIVNMSGQIVSKIKITAETVNASTLSSGLYLVKGITQAGEIYMDKIMKK